MMSDEWEAELNRTIDELTAENAALTQRVAEREAELRASIGDQTQLRALASRISDERDAAIAEAGRLLRVLSDVINDLNKQGTLSALPFDIRLAVEAALTATTPAAASERRVAEQRVIEDAQQVLDQYLDRGFALIQPLVNRLYKLKNSMEALAALDAPGGGA